MNIEKQRAAIAKACGLVKLKNPVRFYTHRRGLLPCLLPDYLNDLEAMRGAEVTLAAPEQRRDYMLVLTELLARTHPDPTRGEAVWLMITAPAHVRAEAFLRAIGLWKGEK